MKKLSAVIIAMSLCLTSFATPVRAANVPVGTKVLVRLEEKVSSATYKKGDILNMRVAADVAVDGKKVIAAEAPATAVVMNASKRFIAGIGGNLDIQVQIVQG